MRDCVKAPSGRELPTESGEGERVTIKFIKTPKTRRLLPPLRGPPSSRRNAFARRFSADGGFGLLSDGAWTATRYACPRRERRESGKFAIK